MSFSQLSQTRTTSLSQSADSTVSRDAGFSSEDGRIIFHPPRGSTTPPPMGTTRYTKDLFEASRLAKMRKPHSKVMSRTYRPTLECYEFSHGKSSGWCRCLACKVSQRMTSHQAPWAAAGCYLLWGEGYSDGFGSLPVNQKPPLDPSSFPGHCFKSELAPCLHKSPVWGMKLTFLTSPLGQSSVAQFIICK